MLTWANPFECQFGPLREFVLNNSDDPSHLVLAKRLHAHLAWRNANAKHPDVLAAALVVEGGDRPAPLAAASPAGPRPDLHHQPGAIVGVRRLDHFERPDHHRSRQTQHRSQYARRAHAVLPPRFQPLTARNRRKEAALRRGWGSSIQVRHPRLRHKTRNSPLTAAFAGD